MNCPICNQPISEDRIEALKILEAPEHLWTCVECSTVKPYKGIFSGENGTSKLILADSVGPSGIMLTQLTNSGKFDI